MDNYYDHGRERRDKLEAVLDTCSPADLCEMLAIVAQEKAGHLRTNWQDPDTAKLWERVGKEFDRAAARLLKLGNPYS